MADFDTDAAFGPDYLHFYAPAFTQERNRSEAEEIVRLPDLILITAGVFRDLGKCPSGAGQLDDGGPVLSIDDRGLIGSQGRQDDVGDGGRPVCSCELRQPSLSSARRWSLRASHSADG